MTSRTYATLDPSQVGPGLLLDSGLAIITTSVGGLSASRKALATVPKIVGDGTFECYIYSDSRNALASRVSIGVALVSSPLDKAVGEDANSFGYFPGTGEIKKNNVVQSTGSMAAERQCIGVWCSATNGIVQFFVRGNYAGYTTFPAGSVVVPAITVSGGDAGDIRAFLRFAPPFDYPNIVGG